LANYIIVEERTNLSRIRKLLKTGLGLFGVFFVNYFIAEIDALVANINTRTGD
jgi:O-antigen/teichoic acid export membrane protein